MARRQDTHLTQPGSEVQRILDQAQRVYNCQLSEVTEPDEGDICIVPAREDEITVTAYSGQNRTESFVVPSGVTRIKTTLVSPAVGAWRVLLIAPMGAGEIASLINESYAVGEVIPETLTNEHPVSPGDSCYISWEDRDDSFLQYLSIYAEVPAAGAYEYLNGVWVCRKDITDAMALAESAYQKPESGIPASDLAAGVIPGPEVFLAVYDQTTYAEVRTAYLAGKLCLVRYEDDNNDRVCVLGENGDGYFEFFAVEGRSVYSVYCYDNSSWGHSSVTNYAKPSGGIPKGDLASAVQTSLGKADTAYQKPSDGIPSTDLAEGVIPDVSNFITKSVNDLVNYYLKSETYTQTEVNNLINAIQGFEYVAVSELPTASANTIGKIYLVPSADPQTQNVKDEYITIDNGASAETRYTWEQIGSTAIDLSGYVTTSDLTTALADYTTTVDLTTLLNGKVDKVDGKGLSTEDYTTEEKTKLSGIAAGAQVNVIETVKVNGTALTPADKAVNIPVPEAEVFWATFDSTTASAISTALSAGKLVLCQYSNRTYIYSNSDSTYMYFGCNSGESAYYIYVKISDDTWGAGSATLQRTSNRVNTLTGNETATNKYPSTKAVYDAIEAQKIFWATYGTTTASEIEAAVTANKLVLCKYNEHIYRLEDIRSGQPYYFSAWMASQSRIYLTVNRSTSAWANNSITHEIVSNKTTSFQSTPDDTHYPSEKLVADSLATKQAVIDSTHKLDYSLLDNTPTIPTVPTISTDIASDAASDTKTTSPKAVKTFVEGKGYGTYSKPSGGIPASDLADGVIPDVSNFITNSVNDLVNYYLKSETYTKAEVEALIGAINQFHYEIAASTSAVTNPQSNVLYLIGPTGSGADKYEEYVYSSSTWVKIGDTSIDLSDYVTTTALNTALTAYTTTANLAAVAISGSYNDLSNKPTIPTVPTISNDISTDASSTTKTTSPQAVVSYVGDPVVSVSAPTPNDGTIILTKKSGDTITVDLNHNHTQYLKYVLCEDEQEYEDIQTKDSSTLYLIPVEE